MYIPPESVFSIRVYKLEMITPLLSCFLTVRKKKSFILEPHGYPVMPQEGMQGTRKK